MYKRRKLYIFFFLQADLKERYSVGELLSDLAGCRASRVLLFVEQSYSGALSKRLMGSLKHVNVVLLNGLPWVHTAEFWASLQSSDCLIDHRSKVRLCKPLHSYTYEPGLLGSLCFRVFFLNCTKKKERKSIDIIFNMRAGTTICNLNVFGFQYLPHQVILAVQKTVLYAA